MSIGITEISIFSSDGIKEIAISSERERERIMTIRSGGTATEASGILTLSPDLLCELIQVLQQFDVENERSEKRSLYRLPEEAL